MKKYILFCFLFPLTGNGILWAQGSFYNQEANIICEGSPLIVLQDMHLQNEGIFEEGESNIFLKNEHPTSIESDVFFPFHNMMIFSNASVQINYHIDIRNELRLAKGVFHLGNSILSFDPGAKLLFESESNYVTSNNGYMTIGEVIPPLNFHNPGNFGVAFISSAADLDFTEVRRGHIPHFLPSGNSIQRWYQIIPNTNEQLFAYLRFYYLDQELDGNDEEELIIWRSDDNGETWHPREPLNRDMNENWIEIFEPNDLAMYTFGPAGGISLQGLVTQQANSYSQVGISVFPNPTTDMINLHIESEQDLATAIRITDVKGQTIYQKRYALIKGWNEYSFNVQNYRSGTYFIYIDGLKRSISFIKR